MITVNPVVKDYKLPLMNYNMKKGKGHAWREYYHSFEEYKEKNPGQDDLNYGFAKYAIEKNGYIDCLQLEMDPRMIKDVNSLITRIQQFNENSKKSKMMIGSVA
jgi:hypothetical protein